VSSPSEPQPPAGPRRDRTSSTQEIPIAAPSGATAASRSLPPHPDAVPPAPVAPTPVPAAAPAAVPMAAPQPTGPVDFVPGLPGLGTPPVPPPVTTPPPVPAPAPAASTTQEPGPPGPNWPQTLESESGSGSAAPGHSRHLRSARSALDRTALLGLGLAALALVLVLLGVSLRFGGESLWSTIPLWSAFATLCAALGVLAFIPFYPGGRSRTGSAWRVAAGGLLGLAVFWLLVVLPNADTDRGFVLTAALGCLGAALWTRPRARS
jgi:hypothetical protein